MSIIKMNDDKSLTVTVRTENYTTENLAEELSFLVPYKYNDTDLNTCTILLSLIGINDTEYSTPLIDIISLENIKQYNDNYFICSIPITKKYTFQPLTYKLWLTFINADRELVLKTGSSLIKINQSEIIEEYLPDSTLSLIDQWEIKIENIYAETKSLTETFDEIRVLCNETQNSISEYNIKHETDISEINILKENSISDIENSKNSAISTIEDTKNNVLSELSSSKSEAITNIDNAKNEALTEIENSKEVLKKYIDSGDFLWNITSTGILSPKYNIFNTITIPSNVNDINAIQLQGFSYFRGLQSVELSDSIKTLGSKCFEYCNSLISINLKNVESINNEAFKGCTSLTSLTIPNTVKSIGSWVFWSCGLQNIKYPENDEFTTISTYSYSTNTALKTVTVPTNVTTITSSAFNGCTALTTITVNKPADSISGAPWGAPNATVVWTGTEETEEV